MKRLGRLGDPRAIAPLNRALSDESWLGREDTADSLKKFADVSSVEPLIALLSRGTGFDRLAAIDALVAIGDSRAAAPLVHLLHNEWRDLRSKAADAVVALADEAAIELLVARLGEEPPERYSYTDYSTEEPPTLDVLVRIGACAADALIDALAGPAPAGGAYRWATEILRRMGAEAVPALVDGLGLPEEGSRAERCAERLADLGEPGRSALVTALGDERAEVRAGAAYGLWHTGDDEAIPHPVNALHDVDADVRGIAALALGDYEQTRLIDHWRPPSATASTEYASAPRSRWRSWATTGAPTRSARHARTTSRWHASPSGSPVERADCDQDRHRPCLRAAA